MLFVESSTFRIQRAQYLDDEAFRALQNEIVEHPEGGKLIRGSGGLRKIRFGVRGKGKSGGIRVIYYFAVSTDTIYLLDLYSKSEQETLTPDQIKAVRERLNE